MALSIPPQRHVLWVQEFGYQKALEKGCEFILIGDEVSRMPGRTSKLSYKSWWAIGDKYRIGHRVTAPAYNGRQECLMVMEGALLCECPAWGQNHRLGYPEAIELPSNVPRTWSLPPGIAQARGFAIYRYCHTPPAKAGLGEEYELHVFDFTTLGSQSALPPQLRAPDYLLGPRWQWQFVELFEGNGHVTTRDGTRYELHANMQVFALRDTLEHLIWSFDSGRVRGIVIYY